MSPDLVWLTIIVNVIIAVVTIANTWALAWYNKRQNESRESPAQHEEIKSANEAVGKVGKGLPYPNFGGLLTIPRLPISLQRLFYEVDFLGASS